tara:strand:- start:3374 stop:4183 length:810 start_codon:yes stop_codon:yes gene_type:complete
MRIIDYDHIEEWGPWIGQIISRIVPKQDIETLRNSKPTYTDDPGNFLCRKIGFQAVIDHLVSELKPYSVRVYHGTRVSAAVASSIRTNGLEPLILQNRKRELENIFRQHPKWPDVQSEFELALRDFGPREAAGRREDGYVHTCFSRNGLLHVCNHYLTHGAEVDSHIAARLFGDQFAIELLRSNRQALLISFLSTFEEANLGANPHGLPTDSLSSLPGILIRDWAYSQTDPSFTTLSQEEDAAARIRGPIPSARIEKFEEISDTELGFF